MTQKGLIRRKTKQPINTHTNALVALNVLELCGQTDDMQFSVAFTLVPFIWD